MFPETGQQGIIINIMLHVLLLLLFLCPVWGMAQQPQEEEGEPSLFELASRERERRANLKKVPIITNSDLKKTTGLISTAVAPAPPASSEASKGEGASKREGKEADSSAAEDASSLRAMFTEARLDVKDAETQSRVLELKMNNLRNIYYAATNGGEQALLQQELEQTAQDIEDSKQAVQQAQQALQQLQQQAAQAGLPPGEIRELSGNQ